MSNFRRRGFLNMFMDPNRGTHVVDVPTIRAQDIQDQFEDAHGGYRVDPVITAPRMDRNGNITRPLSENYEFMEMAIEDILGSRDNLNTSLLVGYGDDAPDVPISAMSRALMRHPDFTIENEPTNYLSYLGSIRPGAGTTMFHALRDFYPQTPLRLFSVREARPFYESLGMRYLHDAERRNPNIGADMFMTPDDPLLRAEGGLVESLSEQDY